MGADRIMQGYRGAGACLAVLALSSYLDSNARCNDAGGE